MAASALRQRIDRTFKLLRQGTELVMKMDPMGNHDTMSIFSFDSSHPKVDPPSEFATGSDIDIGGLSTCQLTAVPSSSTLPNPPPSPGAESSSASSSSSHIAFHGHMSLQVPPQYAGRIRTGYASFRNRSRPTLFGEEVWDLSMHSHIKVVVGYRGWEGWRNRWMCNIQTDGPIRTDLYQHRLDLPPSPASTSSRRPPDLSLAPLPTFTTLHLPIFSFVLTNSGQTMPVQMQMMDQRIRTIGFSLLGGGRGSDGMPFANTSSPGTRVSEGTKRVGSAGFGRSDGEVGMDPELEELIAAEELRYEPAPVQEGGYHRVGGMQEGGVQVTPGCEGYFELCVKSVEAILWDPEAEVQTDDSAAKRLVSR